MSRSTRASESASAGFTLIEALAALAIAAAGLAAIGTLSFAGLRSGVAVEQRLALVATARTIVAAMPGGVNLADGERSGAAGGYRWRIEAGPVASGAAAPAGGSLWEPQHIALRVGTPGGASIEIDTVRLRERRGE